MTHNSPKEEVIRVSIDGCMVNKLVYPNHSLKMKGKFDICDSMTPFEDSMVSEISRVPKDE